MNVAEAIKTRRSIKKFNGKLVAKEDVTELIEHAVYAPNHGMRQPWRLVVGYEENLPKVHTLLKEMALPKWQELSEEELEKNMQKFTLPGAYIFVVMPEDARQKERLEDYGAVSSMLQNLQLLAWEKGIGACWKTPGFLDHPKFREALNVIQGERVVSMLQLGYFDEVPPAKERKAMNQYVTVFGE
jgi:nitroreductase